jgi:hypothetical protein
MNLYGRSPRYLQLRYHFFFIRILYRTRFFFANTPWPLFIQFLDSMVLGERIRPAGRQRRTALLPWPVAEVATPPHYYLPLENDRTPL